MTPARRRSRAAPGRGDGSGRGRTAAGTWRAMSGNATASSHSSHQRSACPTSAGRSGSSVPRVMAASRSMGMNASVSTSPAAGDARPRHERQGQEQPRLGVDVADAQAHEAEQDGEDERAPTSTAAGNPGSSPIRPKRPVARRRTACGAAGRRRGGRLRAAPASRGPGASDGQTQPGGGSSAAVGSGSPVMTGSVVHRPPRVPWCRTTGGTCHRRGCASTIRSRRHPAGVDGGCRRPARSAEVRRTVDGASVVYPPRPSRCLTTRP